MTYYVTMTDNFLSGWGKAKDKTDKLVIICDTIMEATIVEKNAHDRGEMKHINIRTTTPHYNKEHYQTDFHTKEDYSTWFRTDRPFYHPREG
jgi:hypothetical protein